MAKTKAKAKPRVTEDHAHHDKYVGAHHEQRATDEVGSVKAAFKNHTWPASRKALLAHARQQSSFSKADLARLEKIPDRRYKSVVDVANAFKEIAAEPGRRPSPDEVGEVTTVHGNQMAQGTVRIQEYDAQRPKMPQM
jgi:hypothetical protein